MDVNDRFRSSVYPQCLGAVVNLITHTDRPIYGHSHGGDSSLEIIDDLGDGRHHSSVLRAFAIPTGIVDMREDALQLWDLVQQHISTEGSVVTVCPGNGAWLVQRALEFRGIRLINPHPVDISRESTSSIEFAVPPDRVVIIEDVVETGNTARKLREALSHVNCPVILATIYWHDRSSHTNQVREVFKDFDQVLVAQRIRSMRPGDDLRSLSTIARKADMSKNQRYSPGLKQEFLAQMCAVLARHDWLHRLGVDLGYRKDPYSVAALATV